MTYEQRFQLVRESLIADCKESVLENWERMFDMWMNLEADMEFGHAYQNNFKQYFGDYITTEVNEQLWFAGKNIVYAINTFISMKGHNCELNILLEFLEKFISEQLNHFDNDYDTTEWFNNEIDEIEETKEDNPQ